MKLIITDLTRFSNRDIVCTAAVDPKTGQCVRPMPYFSYNECKNRGVHPGMVIEGPFSAVHCTPPHTEDMACDFSKLQFLGAATSEQFESALKITTVQSIHEGFEKLIPFGQKVIPASKPPRLSIITVRFEPKQIEIVDDAYKPEKIKIHIHDNDGTDYAYVAITDLGFHHYAVEKQKHVDRESGLNKFIQKQSHVYLRVGLSRRYAIGSRDGYWLQANGIYTFPDYLANVRSYP